MKSFRIPSAILFVFLFLVSSLLAPVALGASQYKNLRMNSRVSGTLAENSKAWYLFKGTKNTPIMFSLKRSGDLWYNFRVIDPDTNVILKQRWVEGGEQEVFFTPLETKKYVMVLTGYYRYGKYSVKVKRLFSSKSFHKTRKLSYGQRKRGKLAEHAVHTYSFKGKENEPILVTLGKSGDLWYNFRIVDAETGVILKQRWVESKHAQEVFFTPQETKTYNVVLTGYYRYGQYSFSVRKIR